MKWSFCRNPAAAGRRPAPCDLVGQDLVVEVDGGAVQVRANTQINTTLMRILRPGGTIDIQVQSAAQPEVN